MRSLLYRPDIQGLRAIAVLAVMLFHFNPAWLPGGFVGVDVFLVISGFLIVSILLNKKSQPGYRLTSTLQYFYGSRFKRIAPAYFVMLIVVSLLAAVLFLPPDLATYKQGLNKAAWFNSNSYFAGLGDYFAPANHEQPLLHTWSLAVEIQFYLLAPWLVLLVPTKALKWLLWALLLGFTALAEYRLRALGLAQATYYSLYPRLPEFFAGGLVALYMNTAHGGGEIPMAQHNGAATHTCRRRSPTPPRALSRRACLVARIGRGTGSAAPGAGHHPATAGQQAHGLVGQTVVFALPVALARAGLAALLHRG